MIEHWKSITMLGDIEGDGLGTGFLIRLAFNDPDGMTRPLWFIVTNKHVLGEALHKKRTIFLYPSIGPTGQQMRDVVEISSRGNDGRPVIFGHRCADVDIALIDVTSLVISNTLIVHEALSPDAFYYPKNVAPGDLHVEPGMRVCIIGYPSYEDGDGRVDLQHSEPTICSGTVASSLDSALVENGRERPGFLINATIIPGHSGSPVILDPREPRVIDGKHYLGQTMPPLLLGVMTETRFGKVKPTLSDGREAKAFGGLAFAFGAETIAQVLRDPVPY